MLCQHIAAGSPVVSLVRQCRRRGLRCLLRRRVRVTSTSMSPKNPTNRNLQYCAASTVSICGAFSAGWVQGCAGQSYVWTYGSVRISTVRYYDVRTHGRETRGKHMEPEERVHVNLWRTVLELGSGRTGSVALCIEPRSVSPPGSDRQEKKTCDHHHHQHHHHGDGVFHAVKRVQRRRITSGGAATRVLRERDALRALKGVS